jgi:hypothetical protein
LEGAGVERRGHAGEPERAQRAVKFGERHRHGQGPGLGWE